MRDAIPLPALYKGSGLGLGRPAWPIKIRKAQGARTDPLPQPATTRFPASTVCHPRRMGDTWRTCRTEGTGETTTPHPVILGSGRLEDRASAPFSKWAVPPRLPPSMGKARTAPLLRCDACLREPTPRMPPTSHAPPHAAPRAGIVGSAVREEPYRGKNRPACPRTVFGPSPTTHYAYVWPRPGGSCRCTKRGVHFLYPYNCARAV